ncbi:MBL fold metallo-hydrolase [Patescibacteria group bacterium]|nr:MBL fold metallo-hydrolase [Patescibacteria group bacterium]MBU1448545.1 MBL fold metallo-hydrolase [Patescibacteria group bacterium]MBU2613591.1 MBL fold metallo-hydrolase [Patescibacteria group bacterium]
MRISFFGATREVTGSCMLVETRRTRVVVDCGMFQGSAFTDAKNFQDFGFDPSTVDAAIVTHGHLDHVGRLPKLMKERFKGKIYATPPTSEIATVVLEDAEQIMQDEFKREYRPKLYDRKDVEAVTERFTNVDYSRKVTIGDLSFRFRDAGHIFGSAFVEMEEKGGPRAAFSGDLGNHDVPILRPTAPLAQADVAVIESTYGNRIHEDESTRQTRLRSVIVDTIKRHGTLIIPAFAVERTQQLLYELHHLVEHRLVPEVDSFLDSPMAIKITKIIKRFPRYYDAEALKMVLTGNDFFDVPGLVTTRTREESKAINGTHPPKIIIAGSGMMNGGRIQHHLVRYLGNKRNTVLIIGYQARGTLGRRLYSGEKRVDVLGERIDVKASIIPIGAFSAHADQPKLIEWLKTAKKLPGHVYCTHGEEDAAAALASRITEDLDIPADVPRFADSIDL